MNAIDKILDLIESLGLTLADLETRLQERAQPAVDSNEDDYESMSHSSLGLDSVSLVELSEHIPAPAAAAAAQALVERPELQGVSPERLWTDFVVFNRRKKRHGRIHLRAFVGFLRKWEDRLGAWRRKQAEPVPLAPEKPSASAPSTPQEIQRLTSLAPIGNRHAHRSALYSLWGKAGYEARLRQLMSQWSIGEFTASLALHGQAVAAELISP